MKKNRSKRKKATHTDLEQQQSSIDAATEDETLSANPDPTREQLQLLSDSSDTEGPIDIVKGRRTSPSTHRDAVSNVKVLNGAVSVEQHDTSSVIEMTIAGPRARSTRSRTQKKVTAHQKADTAAHHGQTTPHDFLLGFTLAMTLFGFCRTSHGLDGDVTNDDSVKTQVGKGSMLPSDNGKTRTRKRADQEKEEEEEGTDKAPQISKKRRLR